MFTLIDYHFFEDLSSGISLFCEKFFCFGERCEGFFGEKTDIPKKCQISSKNKNGRAFFLPFLFAFLKHKNYVL
jgi:hypothetical protein